MTIKTVYLILFDESNEGSPFNLDRLTGSIVQCNDEMEEIGFPKITWWLFFEMCSTHSGPATHTQQYYNKLTFRKLARRQRHIIEFGVNAVKPPRCWLATYIGTVTTRTICMWW